MNLFSASNVISTVGSNINPSTAITKTVVEAGIRTISGNGKDFVENTIEVVFDPLIEFGSFVDNIFGW